MCERERERERKREREREREGGRERREGKVHTSIAGEESTSKRADARENAKYWQLA
jgi:hypothetical protein